MHGNLLSKKFGSHTKNLSLKNSKTIKEHESGVNQILKISEIKIVTVSDDCQLKVWKYGSDSSLTVENDIYTETTNCVTLTGVNRDIVVTGCHSGNILIHKVSHILNGPPKTNYGAHNGLIRVLISLKTLKNAYFLSADVCGTINFWSSTICPKPESKNRQDSSSEI